VLPADKLILAVEREGRELRARIVRDDLQGVRDDGFSLIDGQPRGRTIADAVATGNYERDHVESSLPFGRITGYCHLVGLRHRLAGTSSEASSSVPLSMLGRYYHGCRAGGQEVRRSRQKWPPRLGFRSLRSVRRARMR
jgi:hypothetical protein